MNCNFIRGSPRKQPAATHSLVVPGSRVCLVAPTVLVVRPTFSVVRDHSPSDEQPDSTEAAGQAATARPASLVGTGVGFAALLCSCCAFHEIYEVLFKNTFLNAR